MTFLAWLFIGLGAGVLLMLLFLAWPVSGSQPSPVFIMPDGEPLPPAADWLLARRGMFLALLLCGSLVTLWLAVALLRRRPWARRAFIALMSVGFVATLAAAALTPLVFALASPGPDTTAINEPPALTGVVTLLGLLIMAGTALAALFAWAGWKLTRQAVCEEFRAPVDGTR